MQLHERMGWASWVMGRVTASSYTRSDPYPNHTDQKYPREPWFCRDSDDYGIILDPQGKLAWGRSELDTDHLVEVLTEQVSDAHLAGLRSNGVSYIFGGETQIDLNVALETLSRELGINRLTLEGGGHTNGTFLRAGLIDEISLAVCPVIDGSSNGTYCIFEEGSENASAIQEMKLLSSEALDNGVVWLRYKISYREGDHNDVHRE